MSTSRLREVWRHRETGEIYLVELEGDRVVSSNGPITEEELREEALAYKHAEHGRTPAFTREAAELDSRRHEYHRTPVEEPD